MAVSSHVDDAWVIVEGSLHSKSSHTRQIFNLDCFSLFLFSIVSWNDGLTA